MGAKGHPPRSRQLGRAQWLALMASAFFAAVVVTRPSADAAQPGWQQLSGGGGSSDGADWQGLSREEVAARAAAKAAETTEQLLAVLQGRPACVAAATTSPVAVHGWVRKAGALPMKLLDGPATKERHQAYYRWRDFGNVSTQTTEVLVDGRPGESSGWLGRIELGAVPHAGRSAFPSSICSHHPHASAPLPHHSPPLPRPDCSAPAAPLPQSAWACRRPCSPTAVCW